MCVYVIRLLHIYAAEYRVILSQNHIIINGQFDICMGSCKRNINAFTISILWNHKEGILGVIVAPHCIRLQIIVCFGQSFDCDEPIMTAS